MSRKKTHTEFVAQVYDTHGAEYSILNKYQTVDHKVRVRHNECGNIYDARASNILKGVGCPKCARYKAWDCRRKTHADFLHQLTRVHGDEYTPIQDYAGSKTVISVRHNKCGNIFNAAPGNLLAGKGCPVCALARRSKKRIKYTHQDYKNIVDGSGEYSVLSRYYKTEDTVELKHNTCGYIYTIKARKFLDGQRCPRCSRSRGENKIREHLQYIGVEYEEQYRFNDCRNERPLPFDFAIFKDDELLFLVEYQGGQHFKAVDYFGGKKSYEQRRKNDYIKKEYCRINNYNLIEIPYWQEPELEKLLSEQIRAVV